MTVELAVVAALLIGGVPLAASAGLRGPSVLSVGFVLGSALAVTVGVLLVMIGLGAPPVLVLAITAGVGVAAGWMDRAWLLATIRQPPVLGGIGLAVVLVALLWRWGAVNLTPDSFRYATTGALLADGRLGEATGSLLLSRGLAVPVLHSPANLIGEFHLRSLTPLFAVATLGVLLWAIRAGLQHARVESSTIVVVQVVAAALLMSINRFIFHAFYVNGHMFIAGWLLLLSGSIWLGTARTRSPAVVTFARCLLVAAVVLARPDGALLAGLVLLPLLMQRSETVAVRVAPLLTLGAVTLGWNVTIARVFQQEFGVPLEVRGLVVFGAVVVIAAIVLMALPHLLPQKLQLVVEATLWAAVVVSSARRPDILKDSLRATYRNTLAGEGGWGVSLGVLGVLVLIVLILSVDPARSALRFPVTAFVPLSLLLAFLREGAYRVGPGDSLNRMLIHLVPLAILLLASAVAAPRWRWMTVSAADDEGSPSHAASSQDVG